MAVFQTRHRVTGQKLAVFVALGFLIGSVLGYIFMATVHAMLEIKADSHWTEEGQSGKAMTDGASAAAVSAAKQAAGGVASVMKEQASPTKGDTIHTLCTSNGSPYLNFQNRIMYGTYKLVQKQPGGEKLVAFTRILHRQKGDVLMDEVPTWRADPLHPECDTWCEFPVADRPNAVQQWINAAKKDSTLIKAPWLLMIETDYVWMKPPAAPPAESKALSRGFPFGYIQPTSPNIEFVMRKMYPEDRGPLADVPNSGPAPVLMRWDELFRITPDWERLTKHIEDDKETKDKLGWVREMYAWSIGAALQGVKFDLKLPPASTLISQPPADSVLGDAAMFHYTWGTIWSDENGREVWKFDKRFYTDANLEIETPIIPLPPAWDPVRRLKQQDGIPVTEQLTKVYVEMITQMNEAIKLLPNLQRTA